MRLIDADHLRSMLQEYIKREQAYIDIGNNTSIAIGHSNGLWEAIAQIDEEPTVEPQIIGNAVNLCETCKYDFPECPKDSNVIFGDGKGNDNVCACSSYEVYVPPISKREWYQIGYEAGVKSVQPLRMKGRWINNCRCSVCGYGEKNYSDAPNNFCPVCGADMRGGQDE